MKVNMTLFDLMIRKRATCVVDNVNIETIGREIMLLKKRKVDVL